MTLSGRNMLLVGQSFQTRHGLTERLARWGFRCHFAGNMRATREMLRAVRVDVVLSDMHLPDGTGIALLGLLAGLAVTAFLCLPVETSCFWLPALDAGKNVWDRRRCGPQSLRMRWKKWRELWVLRREAESFAAR